MPIFLEVWHGARSCWRIPTPLGKCLCITGSKRICKIALHLSPVIIHSTLIRRPGPSLVKTFPHQNTLCTWFAKYVLADKAHICSRPLLLAWTNVLQNAIHLNILPFSNRLPYIEHDCLQIFSFHIKSQ